MSKDLRFEKEEFSYADWDNFSDFSAHNDSQNEKHANAKYRSKQNLNRRNRKRTSALEHDIDKLH